MSYQWSPDELEHLLDRLASGETIRVLLRTNRAAKLMRFAIYSRNRRRARPVSLSAKVSGAALEIAPSLDPIIKMESMKEPQDEPAEPKRD